MIKVEGELKAENSRSVDRRHLVEVKGGKAVEESDGVTEAKYVMDQHG